MPFALAVAVAFLSGFTDVRVADIQSVEVVIMLALTLALMSPAHQLTLNGPKVIVSLVPNFLWLMFFLLCGSVLSLRLDFFPPSKVGLLKLPPWATFVRLFEVAISVSSLFVVALAVRNDPKRLRLLMTAFVWAALANVIWASISVIAWLGGLDLPGILIGRIPRMRGFFGEGGPLGVYLVGALVIQVVRGGFLNHSTKLAHHIILATLMIGVIGSQSKSALMVIVALLSLYSLKRRKFIIMAVGFTVIIPLALTSGVSRGLNGYYVNFMNFDREAYERPTDGNLINGRIMAAVLLPRIVEQHPILGVGVGNYSLVRNDPNILLGLPRTELWDLHGLGLFGYLAELGIPLTLFVMWIYAYPMIAARRSRPWILLLCSYPLLAAVFGVQLNFAYPWIVAGLGLAALAIDRKHAGMAPEAVGAPKMRLLEASTVPRPEWRSSVS